MRRFRDLDNIGDDEIRIVGSDVRPRSRVGLWIAALVVVVLVAVITVVISPWGEDAAPRDDAYGPSLFEPVDDGAQPAGDDRRGGWFGVEVPDSVRGYTELRDTAINDVPLRLFIPHNARASLHHGKLDKSDTSIVYAAQAADVRADNGGIVGAFVLRGEPLAWGLSKRGYCAIIDDVVTVGVADNSPLFEEATEKGGYFFRQYPLVEDGHLVDNAPKGKTVRRALCDRCGEIFMVESLAKESFHDFAQALEDLGCDNAIYLIGSSAYGWAVDEHDVKHEFGEDNYYTGRHRAPKNITYIVWRR